MVTKSKPTDVTNSMDTAENVPVDARNLYQRIADAKPHFDKIVKQETNPHFHSKFASLGMVITAIEQALLDQGVLLVGICQPMSNDAWVVGYRMINIDNPDDKTEQTIPSKNFDPQKQGQAITYYRRYVLGLMLNLNIENDDDGNNASASVNSTPSTSSRTERVTQQQTLDNDW